MQRTTNSTQCLGHCFNFRLCKNKENKSPNKVNTSLTPKILSPSTVATRLSYEGFRGCLGLGLVHKSETPVGNWHNHQCLSSPLKAKDLYQRLVKLVES